MIQPTDIHTITEFRRSAGLSAAIAADKRAHVLTEDGKPKLVVQDAAAYQETMAVLERLETRAQIQAGLDSMRRGESRPAGEALAERRVVYRCQHYPFAAARALQDIYGKCAFERLGMGSCESRAASAFIGVELAGTCGSD